MNKTLLSILAAFTISTSPSVSEARKSRPPKPANISKYQKAHFKKLHQQDMKKFHAYKGPYKMVGQNGGVMVASGGKTWEYNMALKSGALLSCKYRWAKGKNAWHHKCFADYNLDGFVDSVGTGFGGLGYLPPLKLSKNPVKDSMERNSLHDMLFYHLNPKNAPKNP